MFIFILEKSAPITQINKTVSFEHNEEHYIIYNCDDLAQFGWNKNQTKRIIV